MGQITTTMGQKSIIFVFVLIFGLQCVASERKNPLKDPRICGHPECDLDSHKFDYKNNFQYKYAYTLKTISEFFGSGENRSELYVFANVEFIFPKPCEGILVMKNVQLTDKAPTVAPAKITDEYDYDYGESETGTTEDLHPKSEQFADDLQKHKLRFSFRDGIIGEVCPEPDELSWVLNIKKGILSSIQNSMIRFDVDLQTIEPDVSGTCPVEYSLDRSTGTSIVISKVKNIELCHDRYKIQSILQTTPYVFRENKSIWPILKSVSYCNLTIDHSIYQEVQCFERHQLVPFSNQQTGAITESHISLRLLDEADNEDSSYSDYGRRIVKKRSSLLFDHKATPKPTHGEIKASRDLLKNMCLHGFPNIEKEFIEYFTKFLQTARLLSYSALQQLLSRASGICTNGRKHILESLPYIGSTASVQIMTNELLGGKMNKDMAHFWMSSMAFMSHPNEEMLDSFLSLIKYGKHIEDVEYTLGSTAVVHTFCRNNENCAEHSKIEEIIRYLELEFEDTFRGDIDDRKIKERIVVILKGLGNIGIMTPKFIETLKDVIVDDEVPVEIRVQIIVSFRRIDCAQNREFFLDVYRNFTANSEVRILSYIQLMRCPNYISVRKIKEVLETEEVNQVGSYVWSHLTNLAKSSSPVRVETQGLLSDSELSSKFKLDIRKFSRNFEHSLFFDEYNFGTATDANLVFGTDSYVPRIVSLNFTADLFGESINFFEISARAQGFEQLLTATFGPKGPLRAENILKKIPFLQKLVGDAHDFIDDEEEMSYARLKRSPKSSENELQNRVDKLGHKLKYNYNEPRAALGLKVFGNDIKYYTMEGLQDLFNTKEILNPFKQLENILSGKDIVYTKSGVFLDASYTVPMCTGLPLSVHAHGASSIDLRLSGQLHKKNQPIANWVFDIDGKLKPSVSVDILATMKTDAFYTEAGVRIKGNLFSSSAVQGKLIVRKHNLVSLQLSLPQDRNEIFSAKSELLILKDSEEIVQNGIPKRYTASTCTWPIINNAIGLKMCSEYSLPDISKSAVPLPGLALCGPLNVSVNLDKADLSIKKYVMEYRWNQKANLSRGSLVFHTPGSDVPRIMTANLTRENNSLNISTTLINDKKQYAAVAMYNGDPDNLRLETYLDLNGRKDFSFLMNMNRSSIPYGWIYYPKVFLSVNEQHVAGMAGTIQVLDKKDIVQSDINLTFETRKFQTRLSGYTTKTPQRYSTKLQMDYRFQDNRTESVSLEGELRDRGEKSRSEYLGDCKLVSTAYPNLNFVSNVSWLSLLGHMDGKLIYNNAPDFIDTRYSTTIRTIFIRSSLGDALLDTIRTTASLEVIRPIAHVNYRLLFKHEEKHKNGPLHNILGAIRYAPNKEATAVFSMSLPRRQFFAMDTYVNITIPSFNSCSSRIIINERENKYYKIDFTGMWFSGHSILVRGHYQDKSTRIQSYHQIKFMIRSPSFKEFLIQAMYHKDDVEIYVDVQTEYDLLPYGATFNYTIVDEYDRKTYVGIKFRDKNWWMAAKLQSQQPKSIFVEVHVDKLRDIHVNIKALSIPKKKELALEVKWDANRDPSKKLGIVAEFNNMLLRIYDGLVILSYPEKTISAVLYTDLRGPRYNGNCTIGWSANEAIQVTLDAGYNADDTTNNWLKADLLTPFEGWRKNQLSTGVFYKDNLLLANCSIFWAETQNIGIAVMGNYKIDATYFGCEAKLSLNSTIPDVPTLSAHVHHKHFSDKIDSFVDLRFTIPNETLQIYSLSSVWKVAKNTTHKALLGAIGFQSPFDGYKAGTLRTRVSLDHLKRVQGAAAFKVEDRRYTLTMEAYAKKITQNMLQINITTPIEKYKTITCRFGINEYERHIVAEIRAPVGALGGEVLLAVMSFSDFDVMFNVNTPVEAFEHIAVVAKMKPDTIHMSGTWNNITLGFIGVWRLNDLSDFEYSIRVLTPLENFKENGVVARFVRKEELNLEFYVRLAKYKLGFLTNAIPKSKWISELAVPSMDSYFDDEGVSNIVNRMVLDDDNEDDYDYEVDYSELMNYVGSVQVDIPSFPTITGTFDVEQTEDDYIFYGQVHLPQGTVDIKDKLHYPDILNIKNYLKIQSPFTGVPEIKVKLEYSLFFNHHYTAELDVTAFEEKKLMWEVGYYINYTKTREETNATLHNAMLSVKTPLQILKRFDLSGVLEADLKNYDGNISLRTPDTFLSFAGAIEYSKTDDSDYVETSVGVLLDTKIVPYYGCYLFLRKEFSPIENSVNLGFKVVDGDTTSKFRADALWHIDKDRPVNLTARIQTNMLKLQSAETTILVKTAPYPLAKFNMKLIKAGQEKIDFYLKATRIDNLVNLDMVTPLEDFRNMSFQGNLFRTTSPYDEFQLRGNLYRNAKSYGVEGIVRLESNLPVHANVDFKPVNGGSSANLRVFVKKIDNYGSSFDIDATGGGKMCRVTGKYSARNKVNWNGDLQVRSTEAALSNIDAKGEMSYRNNQDLSTNIELTSPWSDIGINSVQMGGKLQLSEDGGNIDTNYYFGELNGQSYCKWSWLLHEDVQLLLGNVIKTSPSHRRELRVYAGYLNPNQVFKDFKSFAGVSVDSLWELQTNASAAIESLDDITLEAIGKLPEPIGDIHRFNIRYKGSMQSQNTKPISLEAQYESDEAKNRLTARGYYEAKNDITGLAQVTWGPDIHENILKGVVNWYNLGAAQRKFSARITTPLHKEDSLVVIGTYDMQNQYNLLGCAINYPESKTLADVDLRYAAMNNMDGHLNTTLKFLNVSWLYGEFNFTTQSKESHRFLKASWPSDNAFFDLKNHYTSQNNIRDLKGVLNIEVPLTTRHIANIDYSIKDRDQLTNGQASVVYNGQNVLKGNYDCKKEERAGFEKDVIDISLQNEFKPLGIHYVHSRQFVNIDYPDYDMKHIEVYELRNSSAYNITGELHVKLTPTGQDYKIIAIHPNRTVILTSDYDQNEEETNHKSKLELADDVWIGYNVKLDNHTTNTNESQRFSVKLFYPKRNISSEGWYSITQWSTDADVSFHWISNSASHEDKEKTMRAGLKWRNDPEPHTDKDCQAVIVSVGHPSFKKDINLRGKYCKGLDSLMNVEFVGDYSDNPEHLATFAATISNLTESVYYRNFTLDVLAKHIATELLLDVKGSIGTRPSIYRTETHTKYRRQYHSPTNGLLLGLVDIKEKLIHYYKVSSEKVERFMVQPYGRFPIYGLNATVWQSPDINTTGYFYIDLKRKYTRMDFNLTSDASHNLQMIGSVPDTRSAYFDIWRNYDEIRVIDVAYYLRMNHSRLVTSQLHWRPKLKQEVQTKLKGFATSIYESLSDDIEYWLKTVYRETTECVGDIWESSKPFTREFIDDFNSLSVLEEDLESFRVFLNQSYDANDFYIKTFINFTLTVIDELAIRDHIESLPKIISEFWQVMGESGKALRKSIQWLIQTIKTSHHKFFDTVSKFIHGDSLQYISNLLQKGFEQYERFIKDLHLSIIRFVDQQWAKIAHVLSNYWKTILKNIEPHVINLLHYVEKAVWEISSEIFEFISEKTNELAQSPYFNQVSTIGQSLDYLYKDISNNDAITNLKKYSALAWEFFKERYFKFIPFGKEINDLITEISDSIKKLKEKDIIKIVLTKLEKIKAHIEWLAEEFELEKRLYQLWALVRNKLGSYAQTALQADNRYREAKTKFIFDPDNGIMELEQKLPMSWHAFNETPKFEEIPEYKLLTDVQDFFAVSNFSLLGYVYSIRANMDPRTWLPPYKAHALIIGSRHYMTFDRRFVGLNSSYAILNEHTKQDQCSYLLANDYVLGNFKLALEPSVLRKNNQIISTRKLTFLTGQSLIEIDVTADTLRIGNSSQVVLPVQVGEVVVYRDSDVLTVESENDFMLSCNLQFDLCWFELGGWYFGQTAGILGTMNNEPYDDYTTSTGQIADDDETFANSWELNNCAPAEKSETFKTGELLNLCNEFFRTSYFSTCFQTLDPQPFYAMCLDMGSNSVSTVLQDDHPAEKGACTAALAYIEACSALQIPLRIPDSCVHCNLNNGSYVAEGTFIRLRDEEIPRTTDVVFIVEAKPCNKDLTTNKNMITLLSFLNNELKMENIKHNRYAVVAFGGKAPFDKPRGIVNNGKVFTDYNNLKYYFDHIETSISDNNDTFDAINVASKLIFRPGASKTFILLPCSNCSSANMKFDYSSVLQLLLEENIILHVLMDKEFVFDKPRLNRTFFGLDRDFAYTKNDLRNLTGDAHLRKQVPLPKAQLGSCTPLALESNGSLFAGSKLRADKRNPTKKFAAIFGKRVAKTAAPPTCQICECTGHNTGVAYITCTSCNTPHPGSLEYDSDEIDSEFNWDWDWDDYDESV